MDVKKSSLKRFSTQNTNAKVVRSRSASDASSSSTDRKSRKAKATKLPEQKKSCRSEQYESGCKPKSRSKSEKQEETIDPLNIKLKELLCLVKDGSRQEDSAILPAEFALESTKLKRRPQSAKLSTKSSKPPTKKRPHSARIERSVSCGSLDEIVIDASGDAGRKPLRLDTRTAFINELVSTEVHDAKDGPLAWDVEVSDCFPKAPERTKRTASGEHSVRQRKKTRHGLQFAVRPPHFFSVSKANFWQNVGTTLEAKLFCSSEFSTFVCLFNSLHFPSMKCV